MPNDLDKCDFNTKSFSLEGMSLKAKIVNVLDGDTVALVIPIFGDYYKFNSRMKGIDTCEIHSVDKDVKNKGLEAKCRLIELLTKQKIKDLDRKSVISFFKDTNCIVWIECHEFDKYGRLLADIYLKKGDKSLSSILIEEKLAYLYDGKTKLGEKKQLEFLK